MHPICFHLGSRPIYWYGVMTALGFLAVLMHLSRLARREGRDPAFGSDVTFWAMVGGILGARAAYVLANLGDFLKQPGTIWRVDQGGLVFYGGLIGGALALAILARRRKVSPGYMADFVISGIPLGHAVGRIGCLLNGCCYGRPAGSWPAILFPEGTPPWDHYAGAPLHPTQVYETLWNLAVYALLLWAYPRRKGDGRIIALYLITYSLGRFAIEFLRGDQRLHGLGLTVAQLTSIALFTIGVALWLMTARKKTTA